MTRSLILTLCFVRSMGEASYVTVLRYACLDTQRYVRSDSFPWWPAVVFEEDDAQVPKAVLSRAHPTDGSVALVRFYEKNSLKNWYDVPQLLEMYGTQCLHAGHG